MIMAIKHSIPRWKAVLAGWILLLAATVGVAQQRRLVLQTGHRSPVTGLRWTPNGNYIVTVSTDNMAVLWDSGSGRMLRAFYPEHFEAPDREAESEVVMAPGGESFFVFSTRESYDKTPQAYLWRIRDGEKIAVLPETIRRAAYTANGHFLIAATATSIDVYDPKTGALVRSFPDRADRLSSGAGMDFDNKGMLSNLLKMKKIVGEIQKINEERNHPAITAFSLSTDDKIALAGYANGEVTAWNLQTGKPVSFGKHQAEITGSALTPDASLAATCSTDSTVNLWDPASGKVKARARLDFPPGQVVFSPPCPTDPQGGRYLLVQVSATFIGDALPVVMDVATGRVVNRLETDRTDGLAFSRDGRTLLTYSTAGMQTWDTDGFRPGPHVVPVGRYDEIAERVDYSANGARLAVIAGNSVDLYQSGTLQLINSFRTGGSRSGITLTGVDSLGRMLLKHDITQQMKSGTVPEPANRTNAWLLQTILDFADQTSPDGKYKSATIETESGSQRQIMEVSTGKRVAEKAVARSQVVKFSPDNRLAVVYGDGWAVIELASGRTIKSSQGDFSPQLTKVSFSPNGRYLLLLINASNYNTIMNRPQPEQKMDLNALFGAMAEQGVKRMINNKMLVFDTRAEEWMAALDDTFYPTTEAQFSPPCPSDPDGGRYLVTFGQTNGRHSLADLWETATGKWITTLSGHTKTISQVFFSRDGRYLFADPEDGGITQIEVATGKLLSTFYPGSAGILQICPDGYYRGTKEDVPNLYYVTDDYKVITFDQLDLRYNRPDRVLEYTHHPDTSLIGRYKRAYVARLAKLGLDTTVFASEKRAPHVDILNTDQLIEDEVYSLHIRASDSLSVLSRIDVWVNKVPVFGSRGFTLTGNSRKILDTVLTIRLSRGEQTKDKIELSATNREHAESSRAELVVVCASGKPIRPKCYFVGIGIGTFASGKRTLKWSVKDIRDLVAALKKVHGEDFVVIDTLFNEKVTPKNVAAIHDKLKVIGEDDRLIIAYSGHGLPGANGQYFLADYSVNFDRPESAMPYTELEKLLDDIRPRQKLLLVDACYSGDYDKQSLIGKKEAGDLRDSSRIVSMNDFELMREQFVNAEKTAGATIIASCGATSGALENDKSQNGIFIRSVLEALREEDPYVDFFGRMRLSIIGNQLRMSVLKDYVSKRVSELSGTYQQPVIRTENPDNDWMLVD